MIDNGDLEQKNKDENDVLILEEKDEIEFKGLNIENEGTEIVEND